MRPAQRRLLDGGALLLLAVLSGYALGPSLRDGGLPGGGEQPDWTGSLWAMWWFGEAIATGRWPWIAADNWVPNGQAPVAFFNLLDAALGAPFVRLLGPGRGYIAACFLTLWLSGAGTWTAARMVRVGRAGALVAGSAVMLSPWLLVELTTGRIAQTLIVAPVLALAALARLRDQPQAPRLSVAAGALVAVSALTYWFYGAFVMMGAAALWVLPGARTRIATLPDLRRAAITCLLLCAIPVGILLWNFETLPGVARPLPAALDHGLLGRGSFSLNMAIHQSLGPLWPVWSPEWEPADLRLPSSLLVLAAAGALMPGRGTRRLRWVAIAGLGWSLTLGPWLRSLAGDPLPIPLPWLLLHEFVPGFERLWWPIRASVLVVPAVAILAGLGADRLSARMTRWPRSAAAGITVVVVAEILLQGAYLPVPQGPGRPIRSELYARLDGGLITTPVLSRSADSRHLLWLQAHHGLPTLAGLGDHLPSHLSPEQAEFVDSNSLLASLHATAWDRFDGGVVHPGDVQALRDHGFRWAVVDPAAYRLGRESAWARQHRAILDAVFGPATFTVGPAAAWALRVPPSDIPLSSLPRIESDAAPAPPVPGPMRRRGTETPTLALPPTRTPRP